MGIVMSKQKLQMVKVKLSALNRLYAESKNNFILAIIVDAIGKSIKKVERHSTDFDAWVYIDLPAGMFEKLIKEKKLYPSECKFINGV